VFLLFLLGIGISSLILVVILALMLGDFAAISLLSGLSAAPPHLSLTAPFRLMGLARPIEVFLLQVLARTLFTDLLIIFDPKPLVFDPLDTLSQFQIFVNEKLRAPDHFLIIASKFSDFNNFFLDCCF